MTAMDFFIYKDNRQQGPYSIGQLAGMGISSETLVWREGMEQWMPAWRVDELKDVLAGTYEPEAAPPPVPPQEGLHDEAAASQPLDEESHEEPVGGLVDDAVDARQPAGRRRSRAVVWLAAAALAFFVLFMTCPGKDKHCDAVSHELTSAISDGISGNAGDGDFAGMLGGMFGNMIAARIVDAVVGQFMTVDNYFIFSVGKIGYDGKEKTVSFGILGHVFTFGADDLREMMDEKSPVPDTMAL